MDRQRARQRHPGDQQVTSQGVDAGSALGGFAEEAAIEGVLRGICYPDEIEALVCDLCDELQEPEQLLHNEQSSCNGGEVECACEVSDQAAINKSSESPHQKGASHPIHQARNPLNGLKQLNGSVLTNLASITGEPFLKSNHEHDFNEEKGNDGALPREMESCGRDGNLQPENSSANHSSCALLNDCAEERNTDATKERPVMASVKANDSEVAIDCSPSTRVCAKDNLKLSTRAECGNSSVNSHSTDSLKAPAHDYSTSQTSVNLKEKGRINNLMPVTESENLDVPRDAPNTEKSPDTALSDLSKLGPVSLLEESNSVSSLSAQLCAVAKAPQTCNVNRNKSKVLKCTNVEQKETLKNLPVPDTCVDKHSTSSTTTESLSKPDLCAPLEYPVHPSDCSNLGGTADINSKCKGCKTQEVQPENSDTDDTSCMASPRSSVSSSMCSEQKANSAPASVAGEAFAAPSERLHEQDGWQRLSSIQQDAWNLWKSEKVKQMAGARVTQVAVNARDIDVQSSFINSIHSMTAQYSARDSKNTGMKSLNCGDSKIPKCMETAASVSMPLRQDREQGKSERQQECTPSCSKKESDKREIDDAVDDQRQKVHEMQRVVRERDGSFEKDLGREKQVHKTQLHSQLPVAPSEKEYAQRIQPVSAKKVVNSLLQPSSYSGDGLLLNNLNQHVATNYQGPKPVKPSRIDSEWVGRGAVSLRLDRAAQKSNPGLKDLDWGWEDDISEDNNSNQDLLLSSALSTPSVASDLIGQFGICMRNDKVDMDVSTKISYSSGPQSTRSLSMISGLSEVSALGHSDSTILTVENSGHLVDRNERAKKKKKKTKPKLKYQEGSTVSIGTRDEDRSSSSQGVLEPSIPKPSLGRCSPSKLKDKEHRIGIESAQRDTSHMSIRESKPSFELSDGCGVPGKSGGVSVNQSIHDVLPSAKVGKRKKTKLSPYAAEYVKQGESYISQPLTQHTTPMVAHVRPLNSLLAQLQRPQTAKQGFGSLPQQNVLGGENPVHTLESVEERMKPEETVIRQNDEPIHGGEPEKEKKCVQNDELEKHESWSSTPDDIHSAPSISCDVQSTQSSPTKPPHPRHLNPGIVNMGTSGLGIPPHPERIVPFLAPALQPYWTTYYDLFCDGGDSTQTQPAAEIDLWAGDFEGQEKQLAFARKCQPILREEYKEIIASSRNQWWRR